MSNSREPIVCRCGHERPAHSHFRRGTDCALCECRRWSVPFWTRIPILRARRSSRHPATISPASK